MNINLEYYKVFYYVTKCGSLTAAAEKLCISQPAVSQAVQMMEKEFGCKLFIRTGKGVKLTGEGKMLYDYVRKGYELIIAGENNLNKMLNLDIGEIRIGASDMTLQYFLLPYLEKYHSLYNGIKVNVTNGPTPETLKYLHDGKIDFGVVTTPFDAGNNMKVKPVRKVKDIFVAGSQFSYLKDRKIAYSEMSDLPLICLEKNTSTRKYLDNFLSEKGVLIEPEFELATSDMIVQFARRNLGIGCVVYDFAKEYLDSGELFELTFDKNIPDRDMCIVTDIHRPLSVAGGKILELIR